MLSKEISVKKYVVRLSGEERERLETLLRKGRSPAQRLLKARILLKADVSEAGEGWSDSRIIKALKTSVSMIYRVRKQLVEEGLEAVLSRKQRATHAVARIFDGEKEAKLIALAYSKPPKGHASTAASPTNKPSSTKSLLGSTTAMPITPRPNWHFTTPNACVKLKHLYPSI
jgi:Homeodomain-like domain